MTDRLLILSCSATKAPAAGLLPAWQRYQGPLWQSWRAADPARQLADCFALSAHFGLVHADEGLPDYNVLMTGQRADAMAANPLFRVWGRAELPRQADERGDRWPGIVPARRVAPAGGWREACVVGGRHYLPVLEAILRDLRGQGLLRAGAPVTIVNGEIGRMRQQLRSWLVAPIGTLAEAA